MKNNIIIVTLVLSGLFYACGNQKDGKTGELELVHKTTTWKNGNLKTEGYYIRDTVKDGLFKEYYPTGKIKAQVNYKQNKREGQLIQYYEDGSVDRKINYVNGVRSGIALWYFENGAIKYYQAYSPEGKSMFDIEYTIDGAIKYINGFTLLDFTPNGEEFKVGDTLKVNFLVVTPDSCKFQFHIYDDVEKKINGQDLVVDGVSGKVKYQKIFHRNGTYKWGGFYTIKFKDGKEKTSRFGSTSIVK